MKNKTTKIISILFLKPKEIAAMRLNVVMEKNQNLFPQILLYYDYVMTTMQHMRLFRVVKRVFNFKRHAANVPKSLVLVGFGTYGSENLILHSWDQTTKIKIANFCSIADNV